MNRLNAFFSKESNQNYVLLFLIILSGLILRTLFLVGPSAAQDGAYYLKLVNDLLTGNLDLLQEETYGFRFLMYFPIAVSVLLFGFNDFAILLPGFILSVAGIILTYKFTLLLQDSQRIALLSAFFMAIFPLEVLYATTLTLDVPSSFFMSLTLYFFVLGFQKEHDMKSEKKLLVFYFFTGITLGISYQIRELAAMMVIFFILLFPLNIWKERERKRFITLKYVSIAIGFSLLVIFELILVYFLTGYPFLRYYHRFGFGKAPPPSSESSLVSGVGSMIFESGIDRKERITQFSRYFLYILSPDYLIGYAFYILAFSLVLIILARKRNGSKNQLIFFSLIWIFYILFYLQFGTQDPFRWVLIEKQARFLASVSMPLWSINALGLGIFADSFRDNDPKKRLTSIKINIRLVTGLLIFIIIISSLFFIIEERDKLRYARPSEEVAYYLKQLPIRPIYAYPHHFILNLEYYFEYEHPTIQRLYHDSDIKHNSYVIISEEIYNVYTFPETFKEVAWSEWTLLKRIVNIRQSPFPGGFSYNYSTYIFYVP